MAFGVKFLMLNVIFYTEETLVLTDGKTSEVHSFGISLLIISNFWNINLLSLTFFHSFEYF